jgi:hypothetical protein
MAMKPKKMRGGGMIKKMRGGGMAGKPAVGMAAPMGGVTGTKRAPTGRSGPNTAKVAMGKKQTLLKKLEHVVLAAGCRLACQKAEKLAAKRNNRCSE